MRNFQCVRRRCKVGCTLALLIAGLAGGVCASAEPILLTFSGVITESGTPGITVGSSYSGEVLYDTTDPFFYSNPPVDFYSFESSDMISITAGGCTFSSSGPGNGYNGLAIVYQQPLNGGSVGDLFEAVADTGSLESTCPSLTPNEVSMELVGPSGLLSGPGVPSTMNLADVVQPSYSGYGTGAGVFFGGQETFQGNFSSIEVAPIPEPSPDILLGSLLCGLVVAKGVFGRDRT